MCHADSIEKLLKRDIQHTHTHIHYTRKHKSHPSPINTQHMLLCMLKWSHTELTAADQHLIPTLFYIIVSVNEWKLGLNPPEIGVILFIQTWTLAKYWDFFSYFLIICEKSNHFCGGETYSHLHIISSWLSSLHSALNRLRLVQNVAARLLKVREHITPILLLLYWLLIASEYSSEFH